MSTRFAFVGNEDNVTGMLETDVAGTETDGAPGTFSVLVFTNFPGYQSLTVPSEYIH